MEDRQVRDSRKNRMWGGRNSAPAEGRQIKGDRAIVSRNAVGRRASSPGSLAQAARRMHAKYPRLLAPLVHQNPGRRFPAPSPSSRFLPAQSLPTVSDQLQTMEPQRIRACLHPLGHNHTSSKSAHKP